MTLPLDLAFVAVATLCLLAGSAATLVSRRLTPAAIGALGAAISGAVALGVHRPGPSAGPLLLDVVSLPLVPLTGLALATVLGAMPVRDRDPDRSAALLALGAVHVGLAVTPLGWPAGLLWVAEAAGTAWVLPGSARRLALPWLLAGAAVGVAGLALGGPRGAELLILAVAIRLGVPPFQTWMVGSFTRAPMLLAVALASPMAALCLVVRVPFGDDPFVGGPVTLALTLSALLAAGLAVVQSELARAIGFLGASVAAVVFVGVLDAEPTGHLGGLMMWGLTGLGLLGLGAVASSVRARLGEVPLTAFQGLGTGAPALALLFLVFGLTAVGAPGTADFVSGELVLHGGLASTPAALVAFVAAVSTQGYAVLHLFYRVFLGARTGPPVPDATRRERLVLTALAAALVVGGLAPQLWIDGWLWAGPDVAFAGVHP